MLLLGSTLVTAVLLVMWIPMISQRHAPRLATKLGALIPIGTILMLRLASFIPDYHSALDEIRLLTPLNISDSFHYSLGDLLVDSILFLVISILSARAPSRIERLSNRNPPNITVAL